MSDIVLPSSGLINSATLSPTIDLSDYLLPIELWLSVAFLSNSQSRRALAQTCRLLRRIVSLCPLGTLHTKVIDTRLADDLGNIGDCVVDVPSARALAEQLKKTAFVWFLSLVMRRR